jgi:hypothetical protein
MALDIVLQEIRFDMTLKWDGSIRNTCTIFWARVCHAESEWVGVTSLMLRLLSSSAGLDAATIIM